MCVPDKKCGPVEFFVVGKEVTNWNCFKGKKIIKSPNRRLIYE
jgi:hypothetical protein